jgi:hypothetical protein
MRERERERERETMNIRCISRIGFYRIVGLTSVKCADQVRSPLGVMFL